MKGYETIEEGKTGRKNGKEGPCLTISDFPLQRYCNCFAARLQQLCSDTAKGLQNFTMGSY